MNHLMPSPRRANRRGRPPCLPTAQYLPAAGATTGGCPYTIAGGKQRGMSLIVILLLLVIVSMLGVASMQIATMGEHGARNDRDIQLSLQSAEAALVDAEVDLQGPNNGAESRTSVFKAGNARFPGSGCSGSGKAKGLCVLNTDNDKTPAWYDVLDEAIDDPEGDATDNAQFVRFGDFTGRSFKSARTVAGAGIQPALLPRYVIENVTELSAVSSRMVGSSYDSALPDGSAAAGEQLYRVTAIGFGPRSTTQTVLQTIYRN